MTIVISFQHNCHEAFNTSQWTHSRNVYDKKHVICCEATTTTTTDWISKRNNVYQWISEKN